MPNVQIREMKVQKRTTENARERTNNQDDSTNERKKNDKEQTVKTESQVYYCLKINNYRVLSGIIVTVLYPRRNYNLALSPSTQ